NALARCLRGPAGDRPRGRAPEAPRDGRRDRHPHRAAGSIPALVGTGHLESEAAVTDEPQVAIRAHFERFPATVKGAFVVQAVDGDPHQVVIRGARLVEASGGSDRAIELPRVTLQAAPRSDLFVPFEFGVTELPPGWYGLQVDVDVDGRPLTVEAGKRFAVAWPRSSVRRGALRVDGKLGADDGPAVSVDHVDCAGDSIRVHFAADAQ